MPERLRVAQSWGDSQSGQPSPALRPGGGWKEAVAVEEQRRKKDGWGAKRKRKETLQVSTFHNITKIPRKLVKGGHEEFKLSNGYGSLLRFMENSPLHPLAQ